MTPDRLWLEHNNLREVGNCLRASGDCAGAIQRGEESLAIAQRLLGIEETPWRIRGLCLSLADLGETLFHSGLHNIEDSCARFEESLYFARRLVEVDKSPEWMSDLAKVLAHLGTAYRYLGELDDALDCFKESLEIQRGLIRREETPSELREIGVTLNCMADTLFRTDLEGARKFYEESLAISRRLVEIARTPEHIHDLSFCLGRVGRVLRMDGDLLASLEHSEESLELLIQLLRDLDQLQPSWFGDYVGRLEEVLRHGIEIGEYARVYEHAVERWGLALAQAEDSQSMNAPEILLSHLKPLMICEIELGKFEDAEASAAEVERLVDSIGAAFNNSSVDREEALTPDMLYSCAEGIDLVVRLRCAQGDVKAEADLRTRAAELRAVADRLSAEEEAAEEEESDVDDEV